MSTHDDATEPAATLADLLRDRNDRAIWTRVEDDVIPKVLVALQRQFASGRHWLDLEEAVRSAQLTALRRLDDKSDPKLETLEGLDSFCRWLIGTARNKFLEKLRRARVEQHHASRVGDKLEDCAQDLLNGLADETADQVVTRLRESLADPTDLAIFEGKLAQKPEVQLANDLNCSTRKVRSRWKRIREILRQSETATPP